MKLGCTSPKAVALLRPARRRRGYGSLLFTMVLVIFIGLLMLVVNYAYLAYSQLRTAEVTDTLARTALTPLLDEHVLADQAHDQSDDIQQVQSDVALFLQELNNAAASGQHLRYVPGSNQSSETDIFVTFGRVDDVTQPVTGGNFTTTLAAGELFNTLRIEAARPRNGANPLYQMVRGMAFPQAASIGSASYATLDSRLIGFRPTNSANSPVVPIGIALGSWNSGRVSDTFLPNGRLELDGRLQSDSQNATNANLVLLNFNNRVASGSPFGNTEADRVVTQTLAGIGPGDFDGDYLGPIAPSQPQAAMQSFRADQSHPDNAQELADMLDDIAQSNEPRRIFTLYDNYNDNTHVANLVGFVAARVLQSDVVNVANGMSTTPQLRVILEPTFYVHFTAETARTIDADGNSTTSFDDVPENLYIHKLRLSR